MNVRNKISASHFLLLLVALRKYCCVVFHPKIAISFATNSMGMVTAKVDVVLTRTYCMISDIETRVVHCVGSTVEIRVLALNAPCGVS